MSMLKLFKKIWGPQNAFREDIILKQERFEPQSWALPVAEQLMLLQKKYFADLKIDPAYLKERCSRPLKKGYSRVAVPKIQFLAKHIGVHDPYLNIGVLVEDVAVHLNEQRAGLFTHYRKGQLGTDRIRSIPLLALRREKFEETVPGDVLILDVDLGNQYAGWTTRRAREDICQKLNLLALSSVDVGWILVINPNRLQDHMDLSIDDVMEEYLSEVRGWVTTLFFYHRGGKLEFGYRWNRRAYFDSGAAVALLPNPNR